MPTLDDLLADCAAHPDDDARRLVWADAVGGERGELVVCQLALEAGLDTPGKSGRVRRRVRELLQSHGRRWASGLAPFTRRVQFHRGFVDAAELSLVAFLENAETLFREAPLLRSLTLTDLGGAVIPPDALTTRSTACLGWLGQVLRHPQLSRFHTIDLGPAVIGLESDSEFNPVVWHDFEAAANERIGRSGALRRLSGAHLRLSHASAVAFERMYTLSALTHARITLPATTPREGRSRRAQLAFEALPGSFFPRLTSLRALDLDLPVDPATIPPTVTRLGLQQVEQDTFEQLARSPVAARLEQLTLQRSRLVDPSALSEFRNLTVLDLSGVGFGPLGSSGSEVHVIDWLAKVDLPRLRELRCTGLDTAMASALARAFGSRLEVLDVRSSRPVDAATLSRFVAGDVVVGHEVGERLLSAPGARSGLPPLVLDL